MDLKLFKWGTWPPGVKGQCPQRQKFANKKKSSSLDPSQTVYIQCSYSNYDLTEVWCPNHDKIPTHVYDYWTRLQACRLKVSETANTHNIYICIEFVNRVQGFNRPVYKCMHRSRWRPTQPQPRASRSAWSATNTLARVLSMQRCRNIRAQFWLNFKLIIAL